MVAAPRVFMSPAEAGALMGLSDDTVRRMCREGSIPAERRGRNFKIPRSAVERMNGAAQEADTERREIIRRLRELHAEEAMLLARLDS